MPQAAFDRVNSGVIEIYIFFMETEDCIKNMFTTTDRKLVAALRQPSFGTLAYGLLDILRLSDSLIYNDRKAVGLQL